MGRAQLISPLCGKEEIHHNQDLVGTYRNHILNDMNPSNLHLFDKSCELQNDLEIEVPISGSSIGTLVCPFQLVVGDNPSAVEATCGGL